MEQFLTVLTDTSCPALPCPAFACHLDSQFPHTRFAPGPISVLVPSPLLPLRYAPSSDEISS